MEVSCLDHWAVMSDCSNTIRVLSKRCGSCAGAVLLYMCRPDSSDKINQKLQKSSGLYNRQDV